MIEDEKKIKRGQIQIELEKQLKVICELEDRFADLSVRSEYVLKDEELDEKEKEDKPERELVRIADMVRNNTKRMLILSNRIRNMHERVEI